MKILRRAYPLILFFLALITVSSLALPRDGSEAAAQRTLAWSVVDTPADGPNGILRDCGINDLAIGPDNRTFYVVSTDNRIPNPGLFKSTDAGYTWSSNISNNLLRNGAFFPVWNIAVAPDDANFIIAITDNSSTATSGGPGMAYYSIDGGSNWTNAGLTLNINEYISCLDISKSASGNRDIAIGTRSITSMPPVIGRLLTRRYSSSLSGTWADQPLPAGTTAVTSLKFSPNYTADQTLAAVSFTAAGAALHLGQYGLPPAPILWDVLGGYPAAYPVLLGNTLSPPIVYPAGNIVRTGIQLPSDYTAGTDMSLSG